MLLLLPGCQLVNSPSSSTPVTENQVYIYEYTQCLGNWTGLGEIKVTFHEYLEHDAAGLAVYPGKWVKYHVLSVENGPQWYLRELASHEVSHLTGASEARAVILEKEWPQVSGCNSVVQWTLEARGSVWESSEIVRRS